MTDAELSILLFSVVLLLALALALGYLFDFLRLPRVIGEISAGFLLGPSFLGAVAPNVHQHLFLAFDEQQKLLSVFYWLGLILLMFSAGFKISSKSESGDRLFVFLLIAGGLAFPFLFGFTAASYFPNRLEAQDLAFSLVLAAAAAVTSIPVLSKIYLDLGIASGRFARLTLTAAAIQDLFLWMVLSVAIAIQQEQLVRVGDLTSIIAATVVFTVVVFSLAPPLIRLAGRRVVGRAPEEGLVGYTLLVCLAFVSFASILKVNIIFGALLAGLVIGRFATPKLESVKIAISNVAAWFFVPIYFALVGYKLNLVNHFDSWLIIVFLAASSAVKLVSVMFATRLVGLQWRHAFDFGVVMNARGGPGIVLASMAFAANIIDDQMFVALVMTSILTSLFAGVWLRWRISSESSRFT